ncbi:MAG: YibE/F family protein [Roseburia sp.]|nr:YibE/F family protein [Roseburia sp.]
MKVNMKKHMPLCILYLCAAILFAIAFVLVTPAKEESIPAEEYAEYERGTVTMVLSDSTERDASSDNSWRGEQLLLVEVTSGQYKGQTLQVSNYVGPLYSVPLEVGDSAVLIISTYADGTHLATVYEYDRLVPIIIVILLFVLATIAVGGKTGAKSLLGLLITLACLFYILIPALMKGAPTIFTTFLVCAYITVISLAILGGLQKKTICAMIGTISGTALAMIFGLISQSLLRISGMRVPDAEALLQLQQTGTPIGISGLLVAGVIISALGAVMDVAMSISSSLTEVQLANPELSCRDLIRSGMNIGRDMVGTMTNTLILALLGSSLVLIVYLYSLGLSSNQFISSSYLAIEVVSSVSSSIGVILAVPVTVVVSAVALTMKKK